jgi:hypothetical protein
MARMNYGDVKVNQQQVDVNIAKESCLTCDNFRAVHPRTGLCYCLDGSKAVFFDAGCSSWVLDPNLKPKGKG